MTAAVEAVHVMVKAEATRAKDEEEALGTRIDSVGERIDRILSNTDGAALDSLTEIASAFQTADQGLVQNVETLTKTSQHDRDAIRSIATANRLVIGDHVALKTTANTVLAAINELVDEQNDLPSNAATKAEVQAVEAKVTTVRNRVDVWSPALALWRETSNPWRVIYKPRRHSRRTNVACSEATSTRTETTFSS